MNYLVNQLFEIIPKLFLPVDFNELVGYNTVLLSKGDQKIDFFGNTVLLSEGLAVVGYCEDSDIDGTLSCLIAKGRILLPSRSMRFCLMA